MTAAPVDRATNGTAAPTQTAPPASAELSPHLITLLREVIYREDDERRWSALLAQQARIRDYVAVLNLDFVLDESEGYAFLRGRPDAEAEDGTPPLPRLARRHALSYPVSLLLALLRKKLAEFDAGVGSAAASGSRLVLTREEILELVRVFFADTPNETRLADQLDAQLGKVEELGFVRRLRAPGQPPSYEVRRILKAFVDAQWLAGLDELLASYQGGARADDGDDMDG
jgi:hypothetical protein